MRRCGRGFSGNSSRGFLSTGGGDLQSNEAEEFCLEPIGDGDQVEVGEFGVGGDTEFIARDGGEGGQEGGEAADGVSGRGLLGARLVEGLGGAQGRPDGGVELVAAREFVFEEVLE